jgi:alpha-tubulin suppressor-like RCC1 family protein
MKAKKQNSSDISHIFNFVVYRYCYSWGNNQFRQLAREGQRKNEPSFPKNTPALYDRGIVSIALGYGHTIALTGM